MGPVDLFSRKFVPGASPSPKQMFKLMDKKIIAMLLSNILLNWPYRASLTFFKFIPGASPFLNLISSSEMFSKL